MSLKTIKFINKVGVCWIQRNNIFSFQLFPMTFPRVTQLTPLIIWQLSVPFTKVNNIQWHFPSNWPTKTIQSSLHNEFIRPSLTKILDSPVLSDIRLNLFFRLLKFNAWSHHDKDIVLLVKVREISLMCRN